jgi:hypothetical protein
LQGLVTCGHCGRRLHVHYRGRNSAPGYHCAGKDLIAGRGVYCLNVGGTVIEQAVANAFLEAITPAAIDAMRLSVEQLQSNHDASLSQWRLEVERTRYEAERAERRYRTVEPLCVPRSYVPYECEMLCWRSSCTVPGTHNYSDFRKAMRPAS